MWIKIVKNALNTYSTKDPGFRKVKLLKLKVKKAVKLHCYWFVLDIFTTWLIKIYAISLVLDSYQNNNVFKFTYTFCLVKFSFNQR